MAKQECVSFLTEIQESGAQDVMLEMLRLMVQAVLEEGMTRHVGAQCHERTPERKGHRNGYKPRTLKTRMGELALSIPQARGIEPYEPFPLAKWQRSERALLVACSEMYFMGVSTRKVGKVLEEMGGFELSAATVSRVATEIDERLAEFRGRRLDGSEWPFLMVDACYTKVRRNGSSQSQAVLVVAGIDGEGRREILTWRADDVESESTWREVFSELRHRGVNGVKWVVSDGHEGIQAAVSKQFPGASWQRCWTHFIRGALAKVSHKDKDALAKDLCGARKFEDVKICLAEAELVARRWEKRYPKVAAQIRAQFEETLAVHALPPEQRRRVYTTNLLERIMREIKRRIRVVGIFPNVPSCDRLVGAQLIEIHEKWQCERARYITFEQETTTATKRSAKRKAA
jgi:putative transposase